MSINKLLVFFFVLFCQFVLAQNDSIHKLREVIVSDSNLKNFSNSKSIFTISDSIIKKNQPSLTALLQYNSTIYFKENGLGMVSSPSFRGTTAQQTAVIWNGININSQLLGQTDFNTISVRDFNSVTVRPGGGSSIYGSGAIGGSIHLNTDLLFKNEISNDLFLNYGSFDTFGLNNKVSVSDAKTSLNFSISRNKSRNNYEYLGTDLKNENGQFENTSLNVGYGYKLDYRNTLRLYSQFYESERHFPVNFKSENKTKYIDTNSRNLLNWSLLINKFSSDFKVGFLTEKFKYFPNSETDTFSFGAVETFITNYNFGFEINKKMQLKSSLDFSQNKGFGSEILDTKRQIFGSSIFFKHQLSQNFNYDLVFKKEFTTNYKSPFLFSLGSNLKINKCYSIKVNGSQNFRAPTFNDLYYGNFGNPNLLPESALQADFGNEFKIKKLNFSITTYYIKTKNLIQWRQINTFLKPENLAQSTNFGVELNASYKSKIQNIFYKVATNYAYTKAKDENTNLQLIFVPKHKLNFEVELQWIKLTLNYHYLFNGYVFTTSDNLDFLKEYQISNTGIYYNFKTKNTTTLGFQILNMFNENYQNTINRPMPGRNFSINLNLIL